MPEPKTCLANVGRRIPKRLIIAPFAGTAPGGAYEAGDLLPHAEFEMPCCPIFITTQIVSIIGRIVLDLRHGHRIARIIIEATEENPAFRRQRPTNHN